MGREGGGEKASVHNPPPKKRPLQSKAGTLHFFFGRDHERLADFLLVKSVIHLADGAYYTSGRLLQFSPSFLGGMLGYFWFLLRNRYIYMCFHKLTIVLFRSFVACTVSATDNIYICVCEEKNTFARILIQRLNRSTMDALSWRSEELGVGLGPGAGGKARSAV